MTEHIDKLRRFDYDDYGFPDTRSRPSPARGVDDAAQAVRFQREDFYSLFLGPQAGRDRAEQKRREQLQTRRGVALRQARKRHKKQTVHQTLGFTRSNRYLLLLKEREEEAARRATEPAKDAMSKSAQKNALRKAKRAAKERECSVE